MKALLIPIDKFPEPLDLPLGDDGSTLTALQQAVGGYVESFDMLFDPHIALYVNEEGAFSQKANRAIFATKYTEQEGFISQLDMHRILHENDLCAILYGPIVAVGFNPDTGENQSLTDEQVKQVIDYFTRVSKPRSGALTATLWNMFGLTPIM